MWLMYGGSLNPLLVVYVFVCLNLLVILDRHFFFKVIFIDLVNFDVKIGA